MFRVLEPEELNAKTGDEDHCAGQRMGIFLELSQPNETHAIGSDGNDREHREDRYDSECEGNDNHSARVVFGCWIHDQRDQGLTGSEHKYGKKDPGGNIRPLFLVMHMCMGGFMGVYMLVFFSIGMEMDMFVRLFPDGSVQSPDKVGKPESDEKPCRCTPPKGFDDFQLKHCRPQSDPHKTENDRTQHMSQATKE